VVLLHDGTDLSAAWSRSRPRLLAGSPVSSNTAADTAAYRATHRSVQTTSDQARDLFDLLRRGTQSATPCWATAARAGRIAQAQGSAQIGSFGRGAYGHAD
jgi:hypothetical protein